MLPARCAMLALISSWLVCALPARAQADDDDARLAGLELEWDAPDACPDRDQVLRWITAYLPVRAPGVRTPWVVHARVREVREVREVRYEIAIAMPGGEAQRSFAGDDCPRVAEAAALVIALSVDPLGTSARIGAPEAQPASDALTVVLAARMAGDLGSLPQPSLGVGAGVALELARARAEADVMAWLPRATARSANELGGGEIGLFSAALRGCYDFVHGEHALGFGPCLGAEAGVSTGRGIDVADAARRQGLWLAALGGLTLRQLGEPGLGSWLSLELVVPLRGPEYAIDGYGTIFQASALAVRASLGAAWRFR